MKQRIVFERAAVARTISARISIVCAAIACVLLAGALMAPSVFAQATNPAYLAEFPSVDNVMQGMKTSDPDESAARQMAAFSWLMQMIVDMAGPRQFVRGPGGGFTADENKLRLDYNTALYNIQKSNPKYGSPLAMHQLQFSLPFRDQMVKQLFPPTFPADYSKAIAEAKQARTQLHQQAVAKSEAQEQANRPAEQKAMDQLRQQFEAQQQEAHMDPETRAMRRCVAAGRVPATCLGHGLMNSMLGNANQILSSVAPNIVGKEVTGPQIAGVFAGAGGWRLEFTEASVALSCADMTPDSHAYTIAFVNNRAVVTVASSPKDFTLAVNGETMSGPGPVTVDGKVSEGVHDGFDPVTGQPARIYQYRRVTRTCPAPNLSTKGAGPGVVDTEKNVLMGFFNDGDTGPPTPPGLRMNGTYIASTGFNVGFFPESAIIGCGTEVARAYPYTVIADGRQAVIKVDAPDHPLMLAIGPNNTLNPGSGPYVVNGRRITGQNDNGDFTFAPNNATCNLAVLAPGTIPGLPAK